MINIVLAGAKYLMILFFAVFTYVSFTAQRDKPEEQKKGTYNLQRALVFFIHALAFLCIMVNAAAGRVADVRPLNVMVLYAGQLIYLIFVMCILPRIVSLSRGLNNCMCMLMTVGFIIQTRLSFSTGLKHLLFTVFSTVIYIIFTLLCKKVRFLYRLTWLYFFVGMALLIAVFIFARVSRGAKVSIDLGFISIQPFEFVKILFVLFVAAAFNKANSFKTVVLTAAGAVAHVAVLVLCSELGTALILAVVYALMVYVSTKKVRYLLISSAGFAVACVAAYMLFNHVRTRVDVWIDPWSDIDNKGYQIAQSLFAIGTGGWLGLGLYNGSPTNVPMVANDFVFSAISEEMGGLFSIFLILLCLCFILMILRIAIRISRPFYKLTAFGLGAVYGLQVFLTIGGAVKLVPSTGINLPFISSGGSSIVASMLLVAIVQALYVISESDVQLENELIEERLIYGTQSSRRMTQNYDHFGEDKYDESRDDRHVDQYDDEYDDEYDEYDERYEGHDRDYYRRYTDGKIRQVDDDEIDYY